MHTINFLLPFAMFKLKTKTLVEKLIVTIWFFIHIAIIIFFILGAVYTVPQLLAHIHNKHLTATEYGQLIKEKYPVYNDLSDQELGNKFLVRRDTLKGKTFVGQIVSGEDYNLMYFDASLNTDWTNDVKTFAYFVFIPSIIGLIGSNFVLSSVYKIWKKHD